MIRTDEIIEIITALGGIADFQEICVAYSHRNHMIVFPEHRSVIRTQLENCNMVGYNAKEEKWFLKDGTKSYSRSTSTKNYEVNPRLLICNIAYMKYYRGITQDDVVQGGGGNYTEQNRNGGEVFNFLPREDGLVYGFVETNYINSSENIGNPEFAKRINIDNLDPEAQGEDLIRGVRVVFISKGPLNERNVVVGWYDNATVYRNRQTRGEEKFGYSFTCNAADAHLIEETKRTFEYPKKNDDDSYNFGQKNVSYPFSSKNEETKKLAERLLTYLDSLYPISVDGFKAFLHKKGYSEYTPSGSPSTIYDYCKRINTVAKQNEITVFVLANDIEKYCTDYDKGGARETEGASGHNSVINALKAFREYVNGEKDI